jgi:hypothetical protein
LLRDVSEDNATVQLRYKGVIVAEIVSDNNNQFRVVPDKKKKIYTEWNFKEADFEWNDLVVGTEFRKFITDHSPRDFRNQKNEIVESFIESTIIDDLTEYGLGNKIPGMTAVKVGGCGIQFPTAIVSSEFYRKGLDYIKYGTRGGGSIDILGRIKSKGIGNTLAIIEVKDFKSSLGSNETFEKVMGQAVAYTTFIRELLRSENTNAEKWWKIFGFNNKYGIPDKLTFKTIVAMPREDVTNSEVKEVFEQRYLAIENDEIELNCLLYYFDKTENIVTKYCFSEDCLKDKN